MEKNEIGDGLVLAEKVILVREKWFYGRDERKGGVEMSERDDLIENGETFFCLR